MRSSLKVLFLILTVTGSASAETGVTDSEIVLGEAGAFTGPSAALGIEFWRGAQSAFLAANEKGVFGRKVVIKLADDMYDAEKAAPAVFNLIAKEKVFALFGGIGTPTIVKALPVVLKHFNSDGLFYFSNVTGAQPQREPPYDKVVFNVRASYRQETLAMVNAFVAAGHKRIGIFVQDDAYGAAGRDGVRRALAGQQLTLAADTTYTRGLTFTASMAEQVRLLREANVDAVISVGAYQACAALIRDVRSAGWNVPIHNLSFVGADQMLSLLKQSGDKRFTENLFVTQVVPLYTDASLPLVKEYRDAMQKYALKLPELSRATGYEPPAFSFGSLEGYLSARVFLAVLEKTGADLTRHGFYAAAEKMGRFEVGVGAPAEFGVNDHQALDKVWLTQATPSGWKLVDDLKAVLK